jgi:hypothetical protein
MNRLENVMHDLGLFENTTIQDKAGNKLGEVKTYGRIIGFIKEIFSHLPFCDKVISLNGSNGKIARYVKLNDIKALADPSSTSINSQIYQITKDKIVFNFTRPNPANPKPSATTAFEIKNSGKALEKTQQVVKYQQPAVPTTTASLIPDQQTTPPDTSRIDPQQPQTLADFATQIAGKWDNILTSLPEPTDSRGHVDKRNAKAWKEVAQIVCGNDSSDIKGKAVMDKLHGTVFSLAKGTEINKTIQSDMTALIGLLPNNALPSEAMNYLNMLANKELDKVQPKDPSFEEDTRINTNYVSLNSSTTNNQQNTVVPQQPSIINPVANADSPMISSTIQPMTISLRIPGPKGSIRYGLIQVPHIKDGIYKAVYDDKKTGSQIIDIIYEGKYKNGVPEGKGKITEKTTFSDGATRIKIYEGTFKNGKLEGEGTLTQSIEQKKFKTTKESVTVGRFEKGVLIEGERTLFEGNRDTKYRGKFINELPEGDHGYQRTRHQRSPEEEGSGKSQFDDTEYYEGPFNKGWPEGYGRSILLESSLHGSSLKRDSKNETHIGIFRDGVLEKGLTVRFQKKNEDTKPVGIWKLKSDDDILTLRLRKIPEIERVLGKKFENITEEEEKMFPDIFDKTVNEGFLITRQILGNFKDDELQKLHRDYLEMEQKDQLKLWKDYWKPSNTGD